MKKIALSIIAFALCAISANAQKVIYQEAQTRILEPMQDVFVRPMAADLDLIKKDRQTYGPFYLLAGFKLIDVLNSPQKEDIIRDAKLMATYQAANKENADMIVAATYLITPHTENGKIVDNGIDITVNGYPARYVNWHKFGDDPKDKEWFPSLINGQQVRPDSQKAKALGAK